MTASLTLPPPSRSTVGAAVERAGAALGEAADSPLWSLDDADLADLVVEAGRLAARAQGLLLRLVGEADARDALTAGGAASSAAFLRHRVRLSPAEASSCARTARAVRMVAPHTGAACAAGRVTGAQAAAICRVVGELPAGSVRAEAERTLIEHAATYDPVVLGRLGRRIAVHVDPDRDDAAEAAALAAAEERAARRVELSLSPDGEGGSWLRGRLDAEGTAVVRAALDPLSRPRPSTADGPDLRPAGRRRGEALVEVCRRVLAAGELPATGGDRPLVVVTVPLAALADGVGAGLLEDGTPISPAAARRLACDAAILPAVLGGAGQPLDLGRARRLFTGPLRRALVLRDRGCAFPGCDRPPGWCEAHHLRHWATGGPTSLANGVLLCGTHHRLVEHGDWQVHLAADGLPDFHPPPWIDPDRRPRRNHLHDRPD
jgi:Domain of unknown function (DUF222)